MTTIKNTFTIISNDGKSDRLLRVSDNPENPEYIKKIKKRRYKEQKSNQKYAQKYKLK